MPGRYTIRLSANGKSVTQALTVRMDPRVKTPAAVLARQHTLSRQLAAALRESAGALRDLRALRVKVRDARTSAGQGPVAEALGEFDRKAGAVEGAGGAAPSLVRVNGELATLYGTTQDADATPTSQLVTAIADRLASAREAQARWEVLRTVDLAALNTRLRAAGAAEIR